MSQHAKEMFKAQYGTTEDIDRILNKKVAVGGATGIALSNEKRAVFKNPLHTTEHIDKAMGMNTYIKQGALESTKVEPRHLTEILKTGDYGAKVSVLRHRLVNSSHIEQALRDPDKRVAQQAISTGISYRLLNDSHLDAILDHPEPQIRDFGARSSWYYGKHTKAHAEKMLNDKSAVIRQKGDEIMRANMDRWNRERLNRGE